MEVVRAEHAGIAYLRPAPDVDVPFDEIGSELIPPHWAQPWPSGIALAAAATGVPAGTRVLELGCGLGLPALAAARAGAEVTAVDLAPAAIDLLRRSAALNGLVLRAEARSWTTLEGRWDLVLGADLLYGHRNAVELAEVLPRLAAECWLTDPGRPLAVEFLAAGPWTATSTPSAVPGITLHRLTA